MMIIAFKKLASILTVLAIFASASTNAHSDKQSLPYGSAYPPEYTANNIDESMTRVSIYANALFEHQHGSSRHALHQQPSALGLCDDAAKKCWTFALNKNKSIPNASTGKASILADIMLPNANISRIYIKGNNQKWSDVYTLATPLKVDVEFRFGYKLLVSLQQASSKDKLMVDNAGINYIGDESDIDIFYNPKVSTFNRFNNGISLRMPTDASTGALVITIRLHDVGDSLPLLDITPEIGLQQPAMLYYAKSAKHAKPILYYMKLDRLGAFEPVRFKLWEEQKNPKK